MAARRPRSDQLRLIGDSGPKSQSDRDAIADSSLFQRAQLALIPALILF